MEASDKISKTKTRISVAKTLDLRCPSCGGSIHGGDININNSLGKCGDCQTVFAISQDDFFDRDRPGRPEIIMPKGTDVLTLNDTLDIRVDWLASRSKAAVGFLTIFALFWNGILALMASGFLASGAISNIAYLSGHLLVGLGMIYYLASIYLNYTDIVITSHQIEISHRPIRNPWRPTLTLNTYDIQQLYVNRYVASTTNGEPNYAYALYAKTKGKASPITLLKGMDKDTQLYLEQEIERYLQIEDVNVGNSITH